jgi:chaperonin GroES
MKIRPLADKVLVQRLEAETKTAGGIVLPDTAKEKPQKGKVISVGEGKVLFTSYAGTEVKADGKEYLIMDESSILAVIED